MAYILIRQKVESYPKWRPAFNEQAADRQAAGQVGEPQVFRSGDDPWEVLVLMEWDELEESPPVRRIGRPERGHAERRRHGRSHLHIPARGLTGDPPFGRHRLPCT